MIFLNDEQGTDAWKMNRVGVITASKFKDALEITAKGLPTAKSTLYAAQVAIERVSGEPCDDTFNSWQMKRGTELEPLARIAYEAKTGNLASESGIVLTDDRKFGFSTDGSIEDDGLLEIKCLSSAVSILEMWKTNDMSEYMHQMQGGMWLTGRKWCDFVMFCPQLEKVKKSLFLRRVERDEKFISELESGLLAFEKRVSDNEAILRA